MTKPVFYVCLDDTVNEARQLSQDERWVAEHPDETPEEFLDDARVMYLNSEGWSADLDTATKFDTLDEAKAAAVENGPYDPDDRVTIVDGNDFEDAYVHQEGPPQILVEYAVPDALLDAARDALSALNQIVNTRINLEGHRNTYSVCAKLEKAIREQAPVSTAESNAALLRGCQAALAYLGDPPSEFAENRRVAIEIIRNAMRKAEGLPPIPDTMQ